jgi:undecaprenyl-phosphate galactose phosphotransferase
LQIQGLVYGTGDLLALAAATLVAHRLCLAAGLLPAGDWGAGQWLHLQPTGQAVRVAVIAAAMLVYFHRRRHYTTRVPRATVTRDILTAAALAMLCEEILLLTPYRHSGPLQHSGLWLPVLRWGIAVALLPAGRRAGRVVLRRLGLWRLDTIVVGPAPAAERVAGALACQPALGYRLAGTVAASNPAIRAAQAAPEDRAAASAELRRLLAAHDGNFLVFATESGDLETLSNPVRAARHAGLSCAVAVIDHPAPAFDRQSAYFLSHGVVMRTFLPGAWRRIARSVKFGLDVAMAATLLALTAPLMLAIAWQIRRDGGPALFRHQRIGAHGRSFPCMKFRTMHVDADALLADILARDPAAASEWEASQKLKDDPRITPIGQVLRRTSLDELPQLINVLRGEMSLVGPRPIVAAEVRFYGRHIADYYQARPGITGLWQVSGRSDTSYPRRVELDVWYVRNWVLWHDIAILLKTVPAVLFRRGAV